MNQNIPDDQSIQSSKTLMKATIISVILAVLVFVSLILPAEYNRDPLGTGKLLGLMVLSSEQSNIKKEVVNSQKIKTVNKNEFKFQKNEEVVLVRANSGVEYKFRMQQFSKITYEWSAQGKTLHFDFHGEPKGDTTGYFESYTLADAYEMRGSMTVPFDGVHGWYWKNETDNDIYVTLQTEGFYEVVGLIH